MFRHLVLFPKTAEIAAVEAIVADDLVPAFSPLESFQSLTISVGALMGPAARHGEVGTVVEITLETLDAGLDAIMAPSFAPTRTKVEALGAQIYVFELREATGRVGTAAPDSSV